MTDEKVGYGNPPRHTRFKPGNRANPLGRGAKKQPTHSDIVKRLQNTTATVPIGGKKTKITRLEAIVQRIGDEAMRGNMQSAKALLRLRKSSIATDDFQKIIFLYDETFDLL
jgi:hypothetical protein